MLSLWLALVYTYIHIYRYHTSQHIMGLIPFFLDITDCCEVHGKFIEDHRELKAHQYKISFLEITYYPWNDRDLLCQRYRWSWNEAISLGSPQQCRIRVDGRRWVLLSSKLRETKASWRGLGLYEYDLLIHCWNMKREYEALSLESEHLVPIEGQA